MEELQQQMIVEHAKARHGFGIFTPDPGSAVGTAHQLNPVCGDQVQLQLTLSEGRITSLSWDGAGCSLCLASASMLATLAPERTAAELADLVQLFRQLLGDPDVADETEESLQDAVAFAGVGRNPVRVKCAMLPWLAAEEALLVAQ